MNGYKIRCEYSVVEAIGNIVLWILISIITLGFGLFIMPYYILKGPINRSYLVDNMGKDVGRLYVEVDFASIVGHAVIWVILTIITLGLAMFVYYPAVVKRLLSGVEVR